MNTTIELIRKDGTIEEYSFEIKRLKIDRYQFNTDEVKDELVVFIFDHDQQHSRLDLSKLHDHLLISFDKHNKLVGVTYCGGNAKGPFEVHNKQRVFILVEQGVLDDPMGVQAVDLSFEND